jgi:hypothetical protein
LERNKVTKDNDCIALKVEKLRGIQPSGLGGHDEPSKYVQKKSWYEMAMQDAEE